MINTRFMYHYFDPALWRGHWLYVPTGWKCVCVRHRMQCHNNCWNSGQKQYFRYKVMGVWMHGWPSGRVSELDMARRGGRRGMRTQLVRSDLHMILVTRANRTLQCTPTPPLLPADEFPALSVPVTFDTLCPGGNYIRARTHTHRKHFFPPPPAAYIYLCISVGRLIEFLNKICVYARKSFEFIFISSQPITPTTLTLQTPERTIRLARALSRRPIRCVFRY